jgi:hypothetical protein
MVQIKGYKLESKALALARVPKAEALDSMLPGAFQFSRSFENLKKEYMCFPAIKKQ